MDNRFWSEKNVLITGFEGFLGSNLTKALVPSGARLFGLDIRTKRRDTVLTPNDYKRVSVIQGSVSNYKLVDELIRKNRVNVVFHLAAEAIVGNCLNDPLGAFSANIKGTWNVLEACRNLESIEAVIVASSDKAYGAHKKLPYTERAPLHGNHPYDVSKSCADLIACAYAHTYNLPVAVTRCGNIYGPGDFNFSRIVPDTMKCVFTGKKLLIRSDGKFIRDYVFVKDIVNGYILLAQKMRALDLGGETFNFSAENPVTVLELVKIIFDMAGEKPGYNVLNRVRYEIKSQYLASGKARRILGWKALFDLKSGMRETLEAYRGYFLG
ncbi:MAG: GDP-mannose 4,6-dehydratase [Candidatus Omnitrophota bacterium]